MGLSTHHGSRVGVSMGTDMGRSNETHTRQYPSVLAVLARWEQLERVIGSSILSISFPPSVFSHHHDTHLGNRLTTAATRRPRLELYTHLRCVRSSPPAYTSPPRSPATPNHDWHRSRREPRGQEGRCECGPPRHHSVDANTAPWVSSFNTHDCHVTVQRHQPVDAHTP
jgi:hypothetical protein